MKKYQIGFLHQQDSIIFPDDIADAVEHEFTIWQNENKVQRLWSSDVTLWTQADENQWTGWMDVALEEHEIPRIEALVDEVQAAGFVDIVLLGIGGSSLFAEVMAKTFGQIANYPHLHILDSTCPTQIQHLEALIDLKKTLFIVASKSGTTLETNLLEEYFYQRVQIELNQFDVGERFLALTDPNTALEQLAKDKHFRAIFHGIPTNGGRYSALSNFGMIPSALSGVDIKTLLFHAKEMQRCCASINNARNNPGVALGVTLGVAERYGKNKVTLVISPGIAAFGAWIEQMLAESTGKKGKGLLPIDQEPLASPSSYGQDRLFVYLCLETESDPEQEQAISLLEQADFMVIRINLPNKMLLGAELFRWEFATAVAGSIIGINPFNQPDVEASKVLALQRITDYEKTKQRPQPSSFISEGDLTLFLAQQPPSSLHKMSITEYLKSHLQLIQHDTYVNLSVFIERCDLNITMLQRCRMLIRDNKKVATCLSFGPRFLHSMGQLYKGGPNTGIFLLITADNPSDMNVPDHQYTFGSVINAQADAYFEVLASESRRIVHLHLGKDIFAGLQQLYECLRHALKMSDF